MMPQVSAQRPKQPVYDYSDKGKTIDSASDSVTITNEKEGEVDTGVLYSAAITAAVLVLAVLAAGVAVFIIRKRRED